MSNPLHYSVVIFVTCVLFTQFSFADEFYQWSDTSGKFSVEAEFVSLKDDELKLRKREGQEIVVDLGKLSKKSKQLALMLHKKKLGEEGWHDELKHLGTLTSMAYHRGKKLYGLNYNNKPYYSKIVKLQDKVFVNEEIADAAKTMSSLIRQMRHWTVVESGWANPRPLTQKQIGKRLQSIDDGFNAGLNGDSEGIAEGIANALSELKGNMLEARNQKASLTKKLSASWAKLSDDIARHSGKEIKTPVFAGIFEYEKSNVSLHGDQAFHLVNITGRRLTNVLVKVEGVKSSKHSWQTEHFFFVPNFPTSKKKGIVLPASAHPSIVNGQAFTWGVGQQPLAVEPGVKTLKVSVWCKELQRENIHLVLEEMPEISTKTEKRTVGQIIKREVKIDTKSIEAKFIEQE